MRLALTPYGLPQVVVWPLVTIAAMVCLTALGQRWLGWPVVVGLDLLLAVLLAWVLSFFRDPDRQSPTDPRLLLAPADGKVTDVATVDLADLGQQALRIGIFLSIFDVHINRSPCRARVIGVEYRPGRFVNAIRQASSQVNQSNNIWIERLDEPRDRLLVRQISGAIARRVVCGVSQGQALEMGQRIGMIKFGSRTELYIPLRAGLECLAQVGQRVKAGVSPVARYGR